LKVYLGVLGVLGGDSALGTNMCLRYAKRIPVIVNNAAALTASDR
jgi:hypothetical protein